MLRLALAAALAWTLAAAPAALGSEVHVTGTMIVFTGTGQDDTVQVKTNTSNNTVFTQTDLTAGSGCTGTTTVTCPGVPSGISAITADLGAGDDDLAAFTQFCPQPSLCSTLALPLTVTAGPGDDTVIGGNRDDTLSGGEGDDYLYGGPGNDTLDGGAGNDIFLADPGTFGLLAGTPGTNSYVGGPGIDAIEYASQSPNPNGVTVTLNGLADDGPGNDNVQVDDVFTTQPTGIYSGVSGSFSTVDTNDHVTGDAGDNLIITGPGDDVVDGGAGFDTYDTGAGNDTIDAQDGNAERIDCGDGNDTVTKDDFDVAEGCETVHSSPALQSDLDGDGVARPADCNDQDPAIHPGAADVPEDGIDQNCDGHDAHITDHDGDGVAAPLDCNDANPAIHPGAREIYGNAVDEDCSGVADPLQTITSPVQADFQIAKKFTLIRRLSVLGPPPQSTIQVRCHGHDCPFARRTLAAPRAGSLRLDTRLKLRRLPAKATLQVRIARNDSIGKVVEFTFRRGSLPASRTLCVRPGDDTARRRC
jgi:hypothetical protein